MEVYVAELKEIRSLLFAYVQNNTEMPTNNCVEPLPSSCKGSVRAYMIHGFVLVVALF